MLCEVVGSALLAKRAPFLLNVPNNCQLRLRRIMTELQARAKKLTTMPAIIAGGAERIRNTVNSDHEPVRKDERRAPSGAAWAGTGATSIRKRDEVGSVALAGMVSEVPVDSVCH